MNIETGLREIDEAKWIKGGYEELNLCVHNRDGELVHCFLTLRPYYCDRGHIALNISGPLSLDAADSFPRYFFSFAEADAHTRNFLKWRIWWHRKYVHALHGTFTCTGGDDE